MVVKVVAARIEGSVVDPQGVGIVGARVDPGLPNLDIRVLARSDEGWYRKTMTTVTDGQGRFVLPAVWPSPECRLRATIEGLPKAWSAPFAVEPAGRPRPGRCHQRGCGRKGDPRGHGPPWRASRRRPDLPQRARVRAQGHGRIHVARGNSHVRGSQTRQVLRGAGSPILPPSAPLKVPPGTAIEVGAGSSEHRIQLEPQEVVWGAVVDEQGQPDTRRARLGSERRPRAPTRGR